MDQLGTTKEKDLQHYLSIVLKRKWVILGVFVATVAAAWFYTRQQVPVYRATASLVIDRNPTQVLSSVRDVVQVGGQSYWAAQDYMTTQFEIIKSLEVTRKVIDLLRERGLIDRLGARLQSVERDPETDLALLLRNNLDVDPLETSMLVYLHAEDTDPELAQAKVNAYAVSYAAFNLEYKRKVILDAHAELNELVARLDQERDGYEKQVYEFEKTYDVGSFENQRAAIKTRLEEATRRLADLEGRKVELEAKVRELQPFERVKDIFSVGAREILADTLVSDLKRDYLDVRQQMMDLSETYGEKHPRLAALQPKLLYLEETIRKQITSRVDSFRRELREVEASIGALNTALEANRQEETRINGIWLQYAPLVAKKTAATEFYKTVRNRQTETSMSAQVETNNVRVQDLALRPTVPVRPRVQLNLAVGVLLGLLLGLLAAILIELLDNTVKTREDLEEDFQLTFLGVLPSIRNEEFKELSAGSSSKELITFLRPRSNISELSRNIRTNLMFLRPENPLHSILITSANPQEGKTTISVNVAISMAVSGKRTLLIDTDLRRARIHTVFGLKRKRGLTEYLVVGGDLDKYVVPTPVENLFLLPAGSVPPNPTELLHSARFDELVREVRERFDFAIYDSPPVTAVTDALVIGKKIDGIVLVARAKSTTRGALRFVLRELRNLNVNVIGAILNDLDLRRRRYYYYRGKYYHYKSHYYDAEPEPLKEGDTAREDDVGAAKGA